jgi:hypothetical protein
MDPFEELQNFKNKLIELINDETVRINGDTNEKIKVQVDNLNQENIDNIRKYIDDNALDINYFNNFISFEEQYLEEPNLNIITDYFNLVFSQFDIYYLVYSNYVLELLTLYETNYYIYDLFTYLLELEFNDNLNEYIGDIILIILKILNNNEYYNVFSDIINRYFYLIISHYKIYDKTNIIRQILELDVNIDDLKKKFIESNRWIITENLEHTILSSTQNINIIKTEIKEELNNYFNNSFKPFFELLDIDSQENVLENLIEDFEYHKQNFEEYDTKIDFIVNYCKRKINWNKRKAFLLVYYSDYNTKKRKLNEENKKNLIDLPYDMIREINMFL